MVPWPDQAYTYLSCCRFFAHTCPAASGCPERLPSSVGRLLATNIGAHGRGIPIRPRSGCTIYSTVMPPHRTQSVVWEAQNRPTTTRRTPLRAPAHVAIFIRFSARKCHRKIPFCDKITPEHIHTNKFNVQTNEQGVSAWGSDAMVR